MRTMTEIRLGQEGIEYVRSCLRQGSDLSEKILQLSFNDGEAFAPVPDDVGAEHVKQFAVGGLISRRETLDWLASHLKDLFRRNEAGTFIVQDVWTKPADVAGNTGDTKTFFHDDNVYYFLNANDLKADSISRTLRKARSYPMTAVFTTFQVPPQPILLGGPVSDELITELAKATREIFVGAYDQEGLVAWRRSAK